MKTTRNRQRYERELEALALAATLQRQATNSPAPGVLYQLLIQVREWAQRARAHRDLSELDDRTLADIGLRREPRRALTTTPVWL